MGLADSVKLLFGADKSLYDVLGCARDASAEHLKKCYKTQSLLFHPDKGGHAEKFICVSAAYKLLSDGGLRAAYDETGEMGDEEDAGLGGNYQSDMDWASYWRALFPEVSMSDIDGTRPRLFFFFFCHASERCPTAFARKYRGTPEERADVIKAYGSYWWKGGGSFRLTCLVLGTRRRKATCGGWWMR